MVVPSDYRVCKTAVEGCSSADSSLEDMKVAMPMDGSWDKQAQKVRNCQESALAGSGVAVGLRMEERELGMGEPRTELAPRVLGHPMIQKSTH